MQDSQQRTQTSRTDLDREKGREYNKKYRSNPENKQKIQAQRKKAYVFRTFNITVKEYDEYFIEASCGICGTDESLVLDHDHKTGKIRGTLCHSCNTGIGLLQDDTLIVERALLWLHGH